MDKTERYGVFAKKNLDGKVYLQYTFESGEEDGVGIRMLSKTNMPGLLRASVFRDGDSVTVSFNVTGSVPLTAYGAGPRAFASAVRGICAAAASASEYLFCSGWILFERQYLFVDRETGEVRLPALPVSAGNPGYDWRRLLSDICEEFWDGNPSRYLSLVASAASDPTFTAAMIGRIPEEEPEEPSGKEESAGGGSGFFPGLRKLFVKKQALPDAAATSRLPVLRIEGGGLYRIDRVPFVIGRGPGCDIRLSGEGFVSRAHAQITTENGEYIIRDLGSRNGTKVNGLSIGDEGRPLSGGDVILVPNAKLIFLTGRGETRDAALRQ